MIKDTVVMLSERPNVRVHNDPLSMCPTRESRLESGRETQGRLSWGYPFFGGKEGVQKKAFFTVRMAHPTFWMPDRGPA
jgi:hypothetical protein